MFLEIVSWVFGPNANKELETLAHNLENLRLFILSCSPLFYLQITAIPDNNLVDQTNPNSAQSRLLTLSQKEEMLKAPNKQPSQAQTQAPACTTGWGGDVGQWPCKEVETSFHKTKKFPVYFPVQALIYFAVLE